MEDSFKMRNEKKKESCNDVFPFLNTPCLNWFKEYDTVSKEGK
jgi:hypothetical protein